MVNYACAFSQSESEKYFESIIIHVKGFACFSFLSNGALTNVWLLLV